MVVEEHLAANSIEVCRATLAIAEAESAEAALQQAVSAARSLTHSEFAAAGLLGEEGQTLISFVVKGSDGATTAVSDFARSLSFSTALRRQSFIVNPAEGSHQQAANGQVTSWLSVPLLHRNKIVGALSVLNKKNRADFSMQDRELLAMLAAHTAVSLQKIQLLESRKNQSEQLEERNRQLNAFSLAVNSIAGELALDKVLQQIVDSARVLIQARYAALGVPNAEGVMETFIYSGMDPVLVQKMPHLPRGLGLLGAIVREKRPIRIPRIAADPRSVGFPEHHPPMDSFLGVPIVAAGQILGNLYLTNKIGAEEFTADDQKLAELLATHAAVAIQNARLYEQVGRLIVVEERTRIGMDLHDGIIQSIYAVGLTLESVRLTLLDDDRAEADRMLEMAIEGLNDTIRDIRNFILDLRPHRFQGNLGAGLARLVREFQANTMVEVTLKAEIEELADLRTPLARAIFFTTQEALANVARHSRAKEVEIAVRRTGKAVTLRVRDNGRGFDTRLKSVSVGHGLSNMRARAEELHGSFQLESAPGHGTAVTMILPLLPFQEAL